ncbi:MAG TPA: hypothetical protein VL285_16625 [Bryobacteraceae bacterium]|nr:hypothetical protein [Bryobacteraceae bacterium]
MDTVLSWPSRAPTSAKQPKSWASEENGNLSNMIERVNAGRRRVREEWEKRQALNAAPQPAA